MNQSIELDHFIYFVLDLNPVLLVDLNLKSSGAGAGAGGFIVS